MSDLFEWMQNAAKKVEELSTELSSEPEMKKSALVKTSDMMFPTEKECKEADWGIFEQKAQERTIMSKLDGIFK